MKRAYKNVAKIRKPIVKYMQKQQNIAYKNVFN